VPAPHDATAARLAALRAKVGGSGLTEVNGPPAAASVVTVGPDSVPADAAPTAVPAHDATAARLAALRAKVGGKGTAT
jgi:hypothetical protein